MFLVVRQGINEWFSQIGQWDIEFLASKWVMMGTIKTDLGKITNILEKTYMGQLEWTRSQMTDDSK
jgi:hypothetical protein